eukprot:2721149-Rhodomonas_salina.1
MHSLGIYSLGPALKLLGPALKAQFLASDTGHWSTPIEKGGTDNGNSQTECQDQEFSNNLSTSISDSYPSGDAESAGIPCAEPAMEKAKESQLGDDEPTTRFTLLSIPLSQLTATDRAHALSISTDLGTEGAGSKPTMAIDAENSDDSTDAGVACTADTQGPDQSRMPSGSRR